MNSGKLKTGLRDLTQDIKAVWAQPNLEIKKEMLRDTIEGLVTVKKIPGYLNALERAKTGLKVDELATNISLAGEQLKVIK